MMGWKEVQFFFKIVWGTFFIGAVALGIFAFIGSPPSKLHFLTGSGIILTITAFSGTGGFFGSLLTVCGVYFFVYM
jgi:hypothetical protein